MKADKDAYVVRDMDACLPPLDRPQLRIALTAMCRKLNLDGLPPELRLCSDATIERYNREFLGGTGPTNILSFPSDNPTLPGLLLLSCPTCRREAMLYGQDIFEHCLRLLAHGLAHLADMDHGPEMDMNSALAFTAAMSDLGMMEAN